MKTRRVGKPFNFVANAGKLIACLCLAVFYPVNRAAADGPWTASTGYSSVQGTNQWYYQQRPQGGGTVTNLVWNSGGFSLWWTSDRSGWVGEYQGVADTHPGSACDTLRKWVAPSAGTVSITGRVYKMDTGGGAGVIASVEKNGTSIWSRTVAYNDATGYMTDSSLGSVSVNSGDSIAFVIDDNGAYAYDQTAWNPTIAKVMPTAAINGGGGSSDGLSADMDYTGGSTYIAPNPCSSNTYGIPNALRTCRASTSFTYTVPISGSGLYNVNLYFDEGWDNAAGVRLMDIKVNGSSTPVLSNFDVYAAGGGQMNTGVVEAIPVVPVVSGDITLNFAESSGSSDIAMVSAIEVTPVSVAINGGGAAVDGLSADVDYTGGASYTAPNPCSSNTYGIPNAIRTCRGGTSFSYSIPSLSPGSYSVNLYFDEGWDSTVGQRLMDITINSIKVLSNFDVYAAAGNHQNTGVLRTIPDVTVTSGGTITINVAESSGSSDLAMVSAIEVIPNPNALTMGPSWTLSTSDTQLGLGIAGNTPAITMLKDAVTNWNWIPASPEPISLINNVYIGATQYTPNWTYSTAVVDTTSGTKVTLTFGSTTPSLALTQTWWAHPGVGPVEEKTVLTNNAGSTLTVNDSDVVAADLTVTSDNAVTLWRFNRASYGGPGTGDPGFATGVFKTVLGSSTSVASTVSNNYVAGAYVLPFAMLDVGAGHGLYIGYGRDFGLFTTSTFGNADAICNTFNLMNSGSFTVASGASIGLPDMFYGTYKGNTDTGSNHMKQWFWNYKMTPTMVSHTNEPLVETCITSDSASETTSFFADNPSLATWGIELGKEDQGWTNDTNTDPPFGWDWSPNTAFWPSGINLGSTVHNNGMLLSLYMGNQYNHVDLATAGGVSSEQQALESRYNGTATNFVGPGYDYWRSDEQLENTNDYQSHLGFVAVLDYMISNHTNFRWENCSSGGSKKSFDLLQRQTFMTTEDSGLGTTSAENYRMAYYANSYMINPVQLKADNGNWTPNTDTFYKYLFRCGFLGAWMWIAGPDGYTFNQIPEYKTHISLYRTHQRPILRGADVYHVLPICDRTNWDGIELFNSTLNKGSVVLFKPNAGVGNSPAIVLQGLVATNTYSLKFQDRSGLNSSYTSVSGSTLMTTGISAISGTTGDYDSEIIWINY